MFEDHFGRFLLVSSGLTEDQDRGYHNLFEGLQRNVHMKNLQNAGWFDFLKICADDNPKNYDDGCPVPKVVNI